MTRIHALDISIAYLIVVNRVSDRKSRCISPVGKIKIGIQGQFFAGISITPFYSGNFFGYYYNVCTITILLSFVGIGISTIYLFTIPSAYSHMYVPEQEKEVSTATQPSVEYNQAPAAPVVTANDLYAKDYAARPAGQQAATGPAQAMSLTCDNCHRQFQAPSNCAGATCPVCGAVKVLR